MRILVYLCPFVLYICVYFYILVYFFHYASFRPFYPFSINAFISFPTLFSFSLLFFILVFHFFSFPSRSSYYLLASIFLLSCILCFNAYFLLARCGKTTHNLSWWPLINPDSIGTLEKRSSGDPGGEWYIKIPPL